MSDCAPRIMPAASAGPELCPTLHERFVARGDIATAGNGPQQRARRFCHLAAQARSESARQRRWSSWRRRAWRAGSTHRRPGRWCGLAQRLPKQTGRGEGPCQVVVALGGEARSLAKQ